MECMEIGGFALQYLMIQGGRLRELAGTSQRASSPEQGFSHSTKSAASIGRWARGRICRLRRVLRWRSWRISRLARCRTRRNGHGWTAKLDQRHPAVLFLVHEIEIGMNGVREFAKVDAAVEIPVHERGRLCAVASETALIFGTGLDRIKATIAIRVCSGEIGLKP